MKVTRRDCGCIYLADSEDNTGILVYYCGYEHYESPWQLGGIKELPEGVYTDSSTIGEENVITKLQGLVADGHRFREIQELLNVRTED